MSTDPYLTYPHRRRGYDHEHYAWETIVSPGEGRLAGLEGLTVIPIVPVQWFPFDGGGAPFRPTGAPSKEPPDYREWSWKDYGGRVGIFRVLAALEEAGATATVAIDAESARRYPRLLEEIAARELDVVAHGRSAADVHHDGLALSEEEALISETVRTVGDATGRAIRGWLSPSRTTSASTPSLLSSAGVEFVLDWANDDLPYVLRGGGASLWSVPVSHELNDVNSISQLHHTAPEWAEQVSDSVAMLAGEAAERGARVLGLTLTPWLVGQPHRVPSLRRALGAVAETPAAGWASASELAARLTA